MAVTAVEKGGEKPACQRESIVIVATLKMLRKRTARGKRTVTRTGHHTVEMQQTVL